MRNELEQKLFKKYPKIFGQKDLDMRQTSLCWGLQCGDGWYKIIDDLCGYVQGMIDNNSHYGVQVEFNTVKEKFGGLRIYTDWKSVGKDKKEYVPSKKSFIDELNGAIEYVCYFSESICEVCGEPGEINKKGYWLSCRCKKCRRNEKIKENMSNLKYKFLNLFKKRRKRFNA